MWPDAVPTPLIGRKHRFLSMNRATRMDSERIRRRRLLASPIQLIDATWNMTGDTYAEFKNFYEVTLVNGQEPFGMVTYDPQDDSTYLTEVTRLLAFREPPTAAPADNNVQVSGLLEVLWESTQSIVNPFTPIPELEYEFTSECKDEVRVFFPLPDDASGTYVLQISASSDGPWADHVYADITGEEEDQVKSIYLNNDYLGECWFRALRPDGSLYRIGVNIPASNIPPPTIEISNLSLSTREMTSDEGFTLPYSERENAWISNGPTYIVPRSRLEHGEVRASWNSLHEIVSLTGEPGAVHKFTRNGSDPTLSTLIPVLNGEENNLFVHNTDFGFLIKARSFKDGCRSPVTCFLIDKKITGMEDWFTAHGLGNSVSGSCDYTHETSGIESGGSCINNFGSPEEFDEYMTEYVISVAAASTFGQNIYNIQVSHTDVAQWYGGFTARSVSASYFSHTESELYRLVSFWDSTRPSWMFGEISISNALEGGGSSIDGLVAIHESGETIAGAGGDNDVFELTLTNYINNFIVANSLASQQMSVANLNVVLTLHHDYVPPYDSAYAPPEEPEEPEEPAVPDEELEIWWDPFETYSETADATDSSVVLDGEEGWGGPWDIFDLSDSFAFEDFETYSDGVRPDTADLEDDEDLLEDGSGFTGSWFFETVWTSQVYMDDFESYADGDITEFINLDGGHIENEVEDREPAWDAPWSIQSLASIFEYFETYADQTLVNGTSGLGNSAGWGLEWYTFATDEVLFSGVKLLIGFEGVDGSTSFVDESSAARTVTPSGNAQIDTAQFKYGAASGLFDGTGDFLTVPHSTDFSVVVPFTIECFIRLNASPASSSRFGIVAKAASTFANGAMLAIRRETDTSQTVRLQATAGLAPSGSSIIGTTVLSTGTWYHAAMSYDGTVLRLFLNGVEEGSATVAIVENTADDLLIGRWPGSTARDFNGWIDEVRFSRKCLYQANFTPPAASFPRS